MGAELQACQDQVLTVIHHLTQTLLSYLLHGAAMHLMCWTQQDKQEGYVEVWSRKEFVRELLPGNWVAHTPKRPLLKEFVSKANFKNPKVRKGHWLMAANVLVCLESPLFL